MENLLQMQHPSSPPPFTDHPAIQQRRSLVDTRQQNTTSTFLDLALDSSMPFFPKNIGKITASLYMVVM
jgi:hypothetical protein